MLPYHASFDFDFNSSNEVIDIVIYIKEATEESDFEVGKLELITTKKIDEIIDKFPLIILSEHLKKLKKTEINFFLKITLNK